MYKEATVKEILDMDEALLIDVRSEEEYAEATIPGAINIPLLNNDERAAVGTVYRREGPDTARRLGLKLVSPKLPEKVAVADGLAGNRKKIVVFCWRGGLRSQFMASLLAAMGYDVYRMVGGYKAYRRYVNEYLARDELGQKAVVLYGLAGVGKTDVLNRLGQMRLPVLDLEGLARHRGSVYGKIGLPPSPTQKAFESSIVHFLTGIGEEGVFIVECESRRIGNLMVPTPVMSSIKKGHRVLLYASLENRVRRIRQVYTSGPGENVKQLQEATMSLAKRIGKNKVEELNKMLEDRKFDCVFAYLLKKYYDPLYKYPEGPSEEYDLSVDATDIEEAAKKIFNFVTALPEYKNWYDGRGRKWR